MIFPYSVLTQPFQSRGLTPCLVLPTLLPP